MKPVLGLRGLMVLCATAAIAAACSSGSGSGAGAGGQGGSNTPSGGSSSGGQHSGASGAGGNANLAGTASGGSSAGQSGGGSSNGGTANGGTANAGAAGEGGNGGNSPSDPDDGGLGGTSLEECFQGLRAGVGTYQDATQVSQDGEYRFRFALETADRFGTSGTVPWLPYRFAIETPGGSVCVTDETALANAYTGSHHNCDDTFSWTQGVLRYAIEHPDTAVDRPASLTIYEGQDVVAGPIRLDLETCHFSNDLNDECRSGGPCGVEITPF